MSEYPVSAPPRARSGFEVLRVLLDDPLLIADLHPTLNTCAGQMRTLSIARGRGLGITRWVADWLPVRIDYLYASSEPNWARRRGSSTPEEVARTTNRSWGG